MTKTVNVTVTVTITMTIIEMKVAITMTIIVMKVTTIRIIQTTTIVMIIKKTEVFTLGNGMSYDILQTSDYLEVLSNHSDFSNFSSSSNTPSSTTGPSDLETDSSDSSLTPRIPCPNYLLSYDSDNSRFEGYIKFSSSSEEADIHTPPLPDIINVPWTHPSLTIGRRRR